MTFWNLYFILKFALFATGHLQPMWAANLVFALALAASAPLRSRVARIVRQVAAVAIAVPLLARELHAPPLARLAEAAREVATFRADYWLEILPRLLPPMLLLTVAGVLIVYFVVNRWLRVATFVIAALIAMPLWQAGSGWATRVAQATTAQGGAATAARAGQPEDYNAALATFRAQESQRQVAFGHLGSDPAAQFDVIVVHVCSLSWDDLDAAKLRNHPMLSRFDYLFTNFSTAASYSGPAAIRVLRASCGQEAHADLYKPAPQQCHLFAQLASAGYTVQSLLNHDGHFDNFLQVIRDNIGVPGAPLVSNEAAPVAMHAFDGSAIKDDYATLANWYAQRASVAGPVALYYNTISLHDGNRVVGSALTSIDSYPQRAAKLMSDVDRLADLVAQSGRRAVIVFVPEHGAALRGDRNQVAGLREIPTPRIVHGPVGVRLVGFAGDHGTTTVIDQPTSFLALAQLLSNLVSNSPFKPGVTLAQYAADLPRTRMIGENEGTVTMQTAAGYAVKTPDGVWIDEQ
ncbi:cellulose biosynthesis protein BcsG [Burkholderia multivorans]|uniref:Cellulose biosynthesis protein BcsG n=1 Tax=Burkholderia multivorans TaxID=87883 RepID=A0ABD7L657_9BURK|nr:cellulose biosynthesis protein BcsG [Burkholderia multivorans]MBN6728658.1 cellulose biosynthesis protein BcsG [Burkholderia multivorans]MBN6737718.1 cellulose biosynthesis protein BcsG [Burkholderia multivorans]MBN7130250.1 cellulose biosynthesis protein BcsG [Burkholderia multivorans]MBN8162486.1 cellulose biosynthesis protein BcsG [Burkholderia multivorans]MBN8170130.1 cellulose biosynthesis protein BcsG [Burkholderia multivorans]